MDMYRNQQRRGPSFQFSYIIGDPFALSTISIAVIGWVIAFGGSIAVDVAGKFPTLTWWGIVFELLVILGVIYMVGSSQLHAYRVAICSFLSMATVYTSNSTNNFVWTGTPASGAVAAGHILLSIINILWMFYFGTTEDAGIHSFVDSFAIHGGHQMRSNSYRDTYPASSGVSRGDSLNRRSNPFVTRGMDDSIGMNYRGPGAGPPLAANTHHNTTELPNNNGGGGVNHQMFTSDQLGGAFENSSRNDGLMNDDNSGIHSTNTEVLSVPTEYPYRATAMYSYQASPDDANEISFEKGEVLEVADVSGRWWQARRENGEVGICPSNYVQLQGGA